MAGIWSSRFVDPQKAAGTTMAVRTAASVKMSRVTRFSWWSRTIARAERAAYPSSGPSELSPTPAAVWSLVSLDPPAAMTPEGEDALLWAISTEDDGSGWDALTPGRTPRQRQIPLHDEGMLAACAPRRPKWTLQSRDGVSHSLLDHPIRPLQERRWDRQTERLGALEWTTGPSA